MYRTHTCGELTKKEIKSQVKVCGWVHNRRDHGGLIFIDLRDRYGLTQLVFNPETCKELHKQAEKLRSEFVIQVEGEVSERPQGTQNPKLKTGEIEVLVKKLIILNESPTPPFEIEDNSAVHEELRLEYRFLDIRRPEMAKRIHFRHKITNIVRSYLDSQNFMEVETPCLTRSTPEGARDFLVPSRLNAGTFYALPQSPQLFKQLLMIGGMDRYFQIARCFRDEDLRADRQLEHTQIDMEMSFVTAEDVMAAVEGMVIRVFKEALNIDIKGPFERIPYNEVMNRFGSDKPDLRIKGREIQDITEIAKGSDFKVFKSVATSGGVIKGISVPKGAEFSRKEIDDLTAYTNGFGAKGLAWLKFTDAGWDSPIKKFMSDKTLEQIKEIFKPEAGSILFFVADEWLVATTALGALRNHLADKLGWREKGFCLSWTVDFPLVQWNEEEKRLDVLHHPFTSPAPEDVSLLKKEPLKVRAEAYDLVLNGTEIGGGSIRIHQEKIQELVFETIGIGREEAERKFSFLLKALKFGAPPHGGIALGLDRLCAILLGLDSIREVIAFPKTQKGVCPLTEAPAPVADSQLKELNIKVVK